MKSLIAPIRERAACYCRNNAPWLMPSIALVVAALTPVTAFADDAAPVPDGRMIGFPSQVILPEPGGTTGTWVILIFLGLVVAAVLFKNSSRSHLD